MDTLKPAERAPLLSDEEITREAEEWAGSEPVETAEGMGEWVRDFYESKITSGELRVVEKIRVDELDDPSYTEINGAMYTCTCGVTIAPPFNFCPGCGAEIV